MIYLLTVFRPPKRIFNYLLQYAKPFTEEQTLFPMVFFFSRALWMLKRAYYHVKFLDFSVFPGRVGWLFYHSGISKLFNKQEPPSAWNPQ